MREESSDVMSRVRQHCVPVWSPTCAGPGSYCLDWQSNYGWLNKYELISANLGNKW